MIEQIRIAHLQFPSLYMMAAALMRPSEHYESPRFAGLTFTLEECMDDYAARKGDYVFLPHAHGDGPLPPESRRRGNFTYFDDWRGFNLPSSALRAFRDGSFHPLLRKERALLHALADCPEPYYLIATYEGGEPDIFAHEVTHGLYHCVPQYAKRVDEVILGHSETTQPLFRQLLDRGYRADKLYDEANAYAVTGLISGTPAGLAAHLAPLCNDLRMLFAATFVLDPGSPGFADELRQFTSQVPYGRFEEGLRNERPQRHGVR